MPIGCGGAPETGKATKQSRKERKSAEARRRGSMGNSRGSGARKGRPGELNIAGETPQKSAVLQTQEVLQDLFARFGKHRFGVKLHAFDFQFAVTHSHDNSVARLGADFERARQRLSLHNQRLVPRGSQRIGYPAEDPLAVLFDVTGPATKQFARANNV